jgi:hypothetical protein
MLPVGAAAAASIRRNGNLSATEPPVSTLGPKPLLVKGYRPLVFSVYVSWVELSIPSEKLYGVLDLQIRNRILFRICSPRVDLHVYV